MIAVHILPLQKEKDLPNTSGRSLKPVKNTKTGLMSSPTPPAVDVSCVLHDAKIDIAKKIGKGIF
ncbi:MULTISPECIES: hypothetical protein [Fibrobacter]|uniref:hypothetical protein n=1 Tax=Fibrobacter TaxID=832 RepID=UPI001160AD35|nr:MULTISPECIES: hypothetical protein [Fibrobacter]MDD7299556.1 hypothetical protein [Fibrobacter intestinalis]